MGKKGKKGGGGPQQPSDQTSSDAPQPEPATPQPSAAPQASTSTEQPKPAPPAESQPAQSPKEEEAKVAPSAPQQTPAAPAEPAEPGAAKKKKKKKKKKSSAQDKDEDEDADGDGDAESSSVPSQPTTTTPASAQAGPPTSGQPSKKAKGKKDEAKGAVEPPIAEMKKINLKCKYTIPKKIMNKRHSPATSERTAVIEVNYLPITIHKWDMDIYHYDITFIPEKPKSLYRNALHMLLRKECPKRHPAFDGKKNLYAAKSHLFKGDVIRNSVTVTDPEDNNREKTFDITVKKTPQKITMAQLKAYMEAGKSQDVPQDVIQATDIALRSGLYNTFIPCARSFFSGSMKPDIVKLGQGMELYDGFFQSAIMGQNKAFLNVDVSNKAFPIEQSILDYLQRELNVDPRSLNHDLDHIIVRDLVDFIKGLKIVYNLNGEKRSYRVNGLGVSAIKHKFTPQGKSETTVAQYFSSTKRVNLRYPNLPLLHVGPPSKNTMVPMELCTIVGRQVVTRKMNERQTAAMVKAAAKPTDERKNRIMKSIQSARYHENPVLTEEFGITVNTKFHTVTSNVFKPPDIRYKDRSVKPNNGEWRMEREKFLTPAPDGIRKWAILIKDGRTYRDTINDRNRGLVALLRNCGTNMGIAIDDVAEIFESTQGKDQSQLAIERDLKIMNDRNPGLQIVIVILPGGGPHSKDAYGNVKRASEFKCGVLTQCLKADTVNKKMNAMTATNILLKMNAKVNGVNHTIDGALKPAVLNQPVMFVGADVTHPAPGTEGNPSIAAVAASFDKFAFRYKMLYRLQGSRQEMIEDLQEMMVEQLKNFRAKCSDKLPGRILYYRDGVSEGQFSEVLTVELDALKRACAIFPNYQPKITFLVVQKRHHTRFFPSKLDGDGSRNNNVRAGTVVDTDITHPTEMDFYLVSHKSIQGTARPTKYHVLFDENQFECVDLEMLTYYLCYMFARCNRSVSYPAPTYYAHLAAFRARAWWEGQTIDLRKLKEEQTERGAIHKLIEKNPMFFV